ncbi:MAG: hypothetical protein AAGI03_08510, partial [Pseudomonadota bacterium]
RARATATATAWEEIRADCAALQAAETVWTRPLWKGRNVFFEAWETTKTAWMGAEAPWPTFARIYDDFWVGRAPDWDYLKQIVLIDSKIWEAGPEAVAKALAIIDAQRRLSVQAEALLDEARKGNAVRQQEPIAGIGHNQPPESIEEEVASQIQGAGFEAQEAIEEIASELKETKPDEEKLEKSSNKLLDALLVISKYCGGKLDLAIDTLIKWGIPAGCTWAVAKYTELSALANGVKEFIKLIAG